MGIAHQIARFAGDIDAYRFHGRLGGAGGGPDNPSAHRQLLAHIHHHLARSHARIAKLGGRLDVAALHRHLAGIEADQIVW